MILSIDGLEYDVMCSIRRQGDVRDTDISGEMLDGSYFHDVAGTYFDYQITFLYPLYDQNKYAAIFEALTAPVDGHAFVLPYNGDVVALTAKVEQVYDDLVEMESGYKFWRALSFSLTSNAPTKAVTLSGAITRGRAPIPLVANPALGDTYTYTANGWVKDDFGDADATYY